MTNGLLLYGRSRGVPAAAGVLLVTAALLGVFGPRAGAADPRLLALAAAAGVTAASAGLAGQDPDLDRTAALSWPPRRAAHVLLLAAAVTVVLAVARVAERPEAALLLRASAGLTGLAALGAALCGAVYAWTPPIGWLAVSLIVPQRPDDVLWTAVGWPLAATDSAPAAWTAGLLLAVGTGVYAVRGPLR
ncbi:hypothetical protein [Streptomyces doudnae]|uniref:ABC transporter permease n=2 Tax=Streptomyces TaxID=1883 RepID=A0ABD5EY62_9ACTN|nr:hypothetical protein [Streptomyces sp. DSM 41981]MDT0439600.1 hypothetical protein [Streptomyces sp. DSM 41981]